MKEEALLQAIGGLDEAILAESEEAIVTKPKRILWRTVIIAATLAMLTIGVAAAGGAFQFIQPVGDPQINAATIRWESHKIDENGVLTDEVNNEGTVAGFRVSMAFPTNDDAPLVLDSPYMIQAPEHWVPVGYTVGEISRDDGTQGISQFSVRWEPYADADGVLSSWTGHNKDHEGYTFVEDYVSFWQYSAQYYNSTNIGNKTSLETFQSIPSRVTLSPELITLAGIPVLKVTIPAFDLTEDEFLSLSSIAAYMDAGEVHLYWSDGDSILSLTYPAWMTDEEIEAILSTVYVVDDLENLLSAFRTE